MHLPLAMSQVTVPSELQLVLVVHFGPQAPGPVPVAVPFWQTTSVRSQSAFALQIRKQMPLDLMQYPSLGQPAPLVLSQAEEQ